MYRSSANSHTAWHLLFLGIGILTLVIAIKHDAVVHKLRPFSEKVRDLPAGFLIPIAILIIISFPPLFGHEVIALLCGVVYGLWIGFAIVAAGTFIGEGKASSVGELVRTNVVFSWNLVCVQVCAEKEGDEARAHESQLWRAGAFNTRWWLLGMLLLNGQTRVAFN
jgi:hypothetical protein